MAVIFPYGRMEVVMPIAVSLDAVCRHQVEICSITCHCAAQGIETTAVAFPYGQMGVVMPIAISLALFANINLGFAQPQASVKPEGGTPL